MRALVDKRLSKGDVAVAAVLIDFASDDLGAFPSLDTLATRTGFHRRSVVESTRRLVDAGYFSMHSGGGRRRTNTYFPAYETVAPTPPIAAETVASSSKTVASNAQQQGPGRHPNLLKNLPKNPLGSELGDNKATNTKRKLKTSLQQVDLPEAWRLYALDQHHPDPAAEWERFRNYWLGRGVTRADWEAIWRNWVLRALQDGNPAITRRAVPVEDGPVELHADFALWEPKMRRQFSDAVLRSYFKGAELSDDGTRVKITVPSAFKATYINQQFTTQLRLVFEPRSCEVSARRQTNLGQPVANEAAE